MLSRCAPMGGNATLAIAAAVGAAPMASAQSGATLQGCRPATD
jgi:hypothetical protein